MKRKRTSVEWRYRQARREIRELQNVLHENRNGYFELKKSRDQHARAIKTFAETLRKACTAYRQSLATVHSTLNAHRKMLQSYRDTGDASEAETYVRCVYADTTALQLAVSTTIDNLKKLKDEFEQIYKDWENDSTK